MTFVLLRYCWGLQYGASLTGFAAGRVLHAIMRGPTNLVSVGFQHTFFHATQCEVYPLFEPSIKPSPQNLFDAA